VFPVEGLPQEPQMLINKFNERSKIKDLRLLILLIKHIPVKREREMKALIKLNLQIFINDIIDEAVLMMGNYYWQY
jgi:hypothetical protein